MKRLKLLLIPLLSISLLVGCANGCKSTPQQVAYQSAGTTIVSVDQAMKLWGAYVAAKHPPVEQEIAVKVAFQRYQSAMLVVCDAGGIYAGSINSSNAVTASGILQSAVANASVAIADLENLITKFGVTLK
jgi:hypothetical protein